MTILRETAFSYRVSVNAIKSKSREAHLVRARIDAAQRMAVERGMTGGEIGRFLNRTDWTCRYYVNPDSREWHKNRNRRYMQEKNA